MYNVTDRRLTSFSEIEADTKIWRIPRWQRFIIRKTATLSLLDGKDNCSDRLWQPGTCTCIKLQRSPDVMSSSACMKVPSPGQRLRQQGFKVYTAAEAAKRADIIMILINDELQADMYKKDIEPNLEARQHADVRTRLQYPLRLHQASEGCRRNHDRSQGTWSYRTFRVSGRQGSSLSGCC